MELIESSKIRGVETTAQELFISRFRLKQLLFLVLFECHKGGIGLSEQINLSGKIWLGLTVYYVDVAPTANHM